jgi:hypothetical protein
VEGIALDALEIYMINRQASGTGGSVELYMSNVMGWQRVETVGSGETYRAHGDDGAISSALVKDGTLIHLSMSMPTGS